MEQKQGMVGSNGAGAVIAAKATLFDEPLDRQTRAK